MNLESRESDDPRRHIPAYPNLNDSQHPDDAVDLLTGDRVVNMPVQPHDPRLNQEISWLISQVQQMSQQGNVDLRSTINAIENGPFPGFADRIFSPQERSRLHNAEPALCGKLHTTYWCLGVDGMLQPEIGKIDTALQTIVPPLLPKIDNQYVRSDIEGAITLWGKNREQNRHVSMYRRTNVTRQGVLGDTALALMRRDLDFFSFELIDPYQKGEYLNIGAGFDPLTRGLGIHTTGALEYDQLLVGVPLHELIHLHQQSKLYKHCGCESDDTTLIDVHDRFNRHFRSFIDQGGKVTGVLEHECETFSANLELLRAAIGDDIPSNVDKAMDALGISRNAELHRRLLGPLIRLAGPYFEGGGRRGNEYPDKFRHQITLEYTRDSSMKLFVLDADGFPVPRH